MTEFLKIYKSSSEISLCVIPAKAGIQDVTNKICRQYSWIPAFAGMTTQEIKN